jgi:hypothetical protein
MGTRFFGGTRFGIGLGLAAALLVGSALLVPDPVFAQSKPASTAGGGRTEAIAGALVGSAAGLNALTSYLEAGGALPADVQRRAVALINDLQRGDLTRDPIALQQAADRIAQTASRTLQSAQIMSIQMDKDFNLGTGRVGLDFGPPSSPAQPGFQKIGPTSSVVGGDRQVMRRPTGDSLFGDGMRGIRTIRVPNLPNGPIRVVLLTDNYTDDDNTASPFGSEVNVNGTAVRVAQTPPSQWIPGAALTAPGNNIGAGAQTQQIEGVGVKTGGAIVINAVVVNGELVIQMNAPPGRSTYLTGAILEPVSNNNSVLYGSGAAKQLLDMYAEGHGAGSQGQGRGESAIMQAENMIQDAMGNMLSNIATAAGPGQVAELLNLPDAVVDPGALISEN